MIKKFTLLIALLIALLLIPTLVYPALEFQDEGVKKGYVNKLNCVGVGLVASKVGITGTMTLDIPSVGDSIYLRLDCSNDPLTGNLDLNTYTLTTTGTGTFGDSIIGSATDYWTLNQRTLVLDLGGGDVNLTAPTITPTTNTLFGKKVGLYSGTLAIMTEDAESDAALVLVYFDSAAKTINSVDLTYDYAATTLEISEDLKLYNADTGEKKLTAGGLIIDATTLVANITGYTDKVGIGTATPATELDVSGDFTLSGKAAVGSFAFGVGQTVDTIETTITDDDTHLPTSGAVNDLVTAQDLDFAGDAGTGAVDLDSQTFTLSGTANEIETSATNQILTVGIVTSPTLSGTTTLQVDAARSVVFSDATLSITGDNYPKITPVSDGAFGNTLILDGLLAITPTRTGTEIAIGGGFYLDTALAMVPTFTNDIATDDSTLFLAAQFMSATRSGTVSSYGTSYNEYCIGSWYSHTNEATYTGGDAFLLTSGIYGGALFEGTLNNAGSDFVVQNIGIATSIDSIETITAANSYLINNTAFTGQIITTAGDGDANTINKIFDVGIITTTSTHNASIWDQRGYGWYNVSAAPIRFGSGYTGGAATDIETYGAAEILHDTTNWDFDIRIATSAIRFNQAQFDTDFIVYGNDAAVMTIDAFDSSVFIDGTFAVENTAFPLARYQRTSASTNVNVSINTYDALCSGDMANGFGSSVTFRIGDTTQAVTEIASIGGKRSGADNSGMLALGIRNTGSCEGTMFLKPGYIIRYGDGPTSDITFDYNTSDNDGQYKWKRVEDYFEYADDILLTTAERLYLRDTDIFVHSPNDGELVITCNTDMTLTGANSVTISGLSTEVENTNTDWTFSEYDATALGAGYIPMLTPTSSVFPNYGMIGATAILQMAPTGQTSSSYTLATTDTGFGTMCALEYTPGTDVLWIDSSLQIYDTDALGRAINFTIGESDITTNPTSKLWGYITNGAAAHSISHQISDTDDYYHITKDHANLLGLYIDMPTFITDKLAFTQTDGNEYIDSLNDGYIDYRATTGHRFGDGTNETLLGADGDLTFVGTAGLNFGSCSCYEIGWTQAATQNTWYNVSDVGFIDGLFNNVTHDGSGELTVTKAGIYKVEVSCDWECDAANKHVEVGFEISNSGSAATEGIVCCETKFANEEDTHSTTALLDLAANATIELCVRTTDAGTPTITIDCVSLNCVQVGGT